MTERDLYDAALIEINKLEAPSMLLEDYNYFINKAIQQYINKAYNRYEINQQATDDLGALKVSTSLNVVSEYTVEKDEGGVDIIVYATPTFPGESKNYYCNLPDDYWHMLSCIVTFNKPAKISICDSYGDTVSTTARKMTSDIAPTIISNAYFKPSYKCPYYSINSSLPEEDDLDLIIDPCNNEDGREFGFTMNLYCGSDKKCTPKSVYINYLKTPRKVHIDEEDLYGEDRTEKMEFPDYVCYEIINEFVKLLLENTADPRLSTNVPINQTIIPQITE